jgi:membrane protein DedA with SNARE-associated domain
VHGFLNALFSFVLSLGVFGPLALGIIDAILVTPLAQDILVVAQSSRHRNTFWLYSLMATVGSLAGVVILDFVGRRGGEAGMKRFASPRRIDYIKRKVEKGAGAAVALACILPPPFPFTPVILGAAALQYPRSKLLSIVGFARALRFFGLGILAQYFGQAILRLAKSPVVWWSIFGLIVVSIAASAYSLYGIIKRSRAKD